MDRTQELKIEILEEELKKRMAKRERIEKSIKEIQEKIDKIRSYSPPTRKEKDSKSDYSTPMNSRIEQPIRNDLTTSAFNQFK